MTSVIERPLGEVLADGLAVVGAVVAAFEPATLAGADARRLAELFAEGEKLCAAGKALAAKRAADTSAWTGGGARTPEEWLAALSGTSVTTASSTLNMAERLAEQPRLEEALKTGQVSLAQAGVISEAAHRAGPADPGAGDRLLGTATSGGDFRRLQHHCRQVVAAAESRQEDRDRHEGLRRRRFFRTWVDAEGAGRGEFRMAPGEYARFMALFKPFQDRAFSLARAAGQRESYQAYGADGLVAMAEAAHRGGQAGASSDRVRVPATLIALVDLAALRRGSAGPEETCEIVGVGPVPVSALDSLLGDAFFAAAVTEGCDIRRVVHLGRDPTALQRTALWVRDRACVHCGSLHNLEIDHVDEWSGTARTELDKLAFLCRRCHGLKTYRHWRLVGSPGRYTLVEPGRAPAPP